MRRIIPKRPEAWDRRTVSGFLILPKTIGREQRWFERATWTEHYSPDFGILDGAWVAIEWVDPATQPERDGRGDG